MTNYGPSRLLTVVASMPAIWGTAETFRTLPDRRL